MRNTGWILVVLGAMIAVGTTCPGSLQADEADVFFDDSFVHEIHITFDDADWYDTLYDSHDNDPDDPFFPAAVECDGVAIDPVGVRFKGNSSFSIPGVKKSFKIDFNEYDDDTTFVGLKKLNLNNGFKDPTLLRAKLFLDFAGAWVPTIRAVHTRVYVNGTYWGLYTAVEQVDKTFAESRFGGDEDGNLFKGAASDDLSGPNADFGSDLTWLGSDPVDYHESYQLKTNEEEDDYSQLIEFIDILNNESPVDFPTLLEPVFDVQNALAALALNNLCVNLDAYNGSAHNYYVYDRDDSGKITHIHWDTNEAFGRFLMFVGHGEDPLEMDPFWLPQGEERPLMENLWANSDYSNDYLCYLEQMLDDGFDEATMQARIDELADLIRADVYADSNKMYSNSQFEQNLYTDIRDGMDTIYGLLNFVQQRASYLNDRLDDFVLDCSETPSDLVGTLFINEFMAENDTTVQDPDGTGFPDWIEIFNAGSSAIDLGGLYLTDDLTDPTQWQIPLGISIPAGGHLLFWADNDEDQGDTHTNFKLSADGEEIGLYDSDGVSEIDSIVFGAQDADVSYGRYPDGDEDWMFFTAPTPGDENRYGDNSLILISAAGYAAGAGGSFWVTDVDLNNAGSQTMTYSFWWLPRGEDNSQPTMSDPVTLGPGMSVRYANVLDEVFELDSADSPFGAIAISASGSEALSIARIYNQDEAGQGGTFGQALPGVAAGDLIMGGETRRLIFMSEDDDFRANLGCQNGTDTEISINYERFDDTGASLDVGVMNLAAFSNDQVNQIFSDSGPVNGYVDVWSDIAGAAFHCYGSVVDNITGDPTTILPQSETADNLTFISAAGFASGTGDSFWVTDVDLNNAGTGLMTYEFRWLPRGEDNSQPMVSNSFNLSAGKSVRYANILGEVFELDSADAPFGAIALSTTGSDALTIARIYNQDEVGQGGTFGQALPGVAVGDLIMEGDRQRIIFLSEDDDFRANLGCQNGSDGDISINYEKFDDAGASLEVGTMNLAAYSNDQVNRIFSESSPVNGYVDVWSDTAGAAFYCYGSVVDNVTGDPTTILPQ